MGKHEDTLSLEEQAAQLMPLWASIWVQVVNNYGPRQIELTA